MLAHFSKINRITLQKKKKNKIKLKEINGFFSSIKQINIEFLNQKTVAFLKNINYQNEQQ